MFVTNYEMTLGAVIAVNERNIRIPEELSVVCFDQPRIFQGMEPLFTYVEQNSFEMGRRAAELLREAFETGQEHACQKLVLEPKLMIHHSTQTFVK